MKKNKTTNPQPTATTKGVQVDVNMIIAVFGIVALYFGSKGKNVNFSWKGMRLSTK